MAAKPNVEIVFWNRHAAELYQWTEEEALYMNVSSLAAPDFLEQQQKDIATMTKGENQKRLFKVRRKDHTMFMAYVSDAAIMNGDELEYMVGVSSDQQALYDAMTELQHIKKNLNQESESRLAQLVKAESVALSQARATEEAEARSEVAIQTMSMFSHELRTPVQGIMDITSLLMLEYEQQHAKASLVRKGKEFPLSSLDKDWSEAESTRTTAQISLVSSSPLPHTLSHKSSLYSSQPPTTISSLSPLSGSQSASTSCSRGYTGRFEDTVFENLCIIQSSSQILLTLINNLLDVRKMSTGMMESFELEPIAVSSIIHKSVQSVKPMSLLSSVTLRVTKGALDTSDPHFCIGSPLRVQEVMINVIGNAIKYSSSTSLVAGGDPVSVDINLRSATREQAQHEAAESLCSSLNQGDEMDDNRPDLLTLLKVLSKRY